MGIKLYWMPFSAPCRAITMCAKALGVELELVQVNLMAGEHMTPEYIKMNPQHTIPVLEDGDLVIAESRAALQYLGNAHAKDDYLYPKDPKKRAMVDQRLFFDACSLYTSFMNAYYVIFLEKKRPEEAKIQKFDEKLGFLEEFLTRTKFAAGDNLTIADFSIVATLTTAEVSGHSMAKYPKITAYLATCKTLIDDYEEVNGKGATEFANFINGILKHLP